MTVALPLPETRKTPDRTIGLIVILFTSFTFSGILSSAFITVLTAEPCNCNASCFLLNILPSSWNESMAPLTTRNSNPYVANKPSTISLSSPIWLPEWSAVTFRTKSDNGTLETIRCIVNRKSSLSTPDINLACSGCSFDKRRNPFALIKRSNTPNHNSLCLYLDVASFAGVSDLEFRSHRSNATTRILRTLWTSFSCLLGSDEVLRDLLFPWVNGRPVWFRTTSDDKLRIVRFSPIIRVSSVCRTSCKALVTLPILSSKYADASAISYSSQSRRHSSVR